MEIVTSWERKGMERGMERCRLAVAGAIEALQDVLLDVLVSRFGVLEASLVQRVRSIDSIPDLRNLTHKALTATSLVNLELADPN